MDKDTISRLALWYRCGSGCRRLVPEPPYFVITPPSSREHRDARRRQFLADQAVLRFHTSAEVGES